MNELINKIPGILFAGIYSVIVFFIAVNWLLINKRLLGIQNKWLAFAIMLFVFGYLKHKIGYYTSLDSAYCKQTEICEKLAKEMRSTPENRIKAFIGFEQNVWLEAAGEGLVFVLVGVPVFLLVQPHVLAAFLTGISAHLISGYSGINAKFCRTSCNINPLAG